MVIKYLNLEKPETGVKKLINQDKIIILTAEALLLVLHYSVPNHFLALHIILGTLSYIFIPGFLLVKVLGIDPGIEETVAISLLFGFSVQIMLITLFWSFLIEPVNLALAIPILTIVVVFILVLKLSVNFQFKLPRINKSSPVFIILILATLVRLYYFSANVSSLGIDGGLYCDFARTIVSAGRFSSNIINDDSLDPLFNVKGFMNYPLTVFSITLFFLIGDISYTSAKLFVLFVGVLVVFLVYGLSKELFGKETALIAGLISAFFPLLSYYSSILHGPEILSTLFVLASTYFFTLGINGNGCKLRHLSLSGVFIAMTYGAWGIQTFIPLVVPLIITFLLFKIKNKRISFYGVVLMSVSFYAVRFSSIPSIELLIPIMLFTCLLVLYIKCKDTEYVKITFFVATIVLLLQLFFMRNYLIPNIYVTRSTQTWVQDPERVLNPLTFTSQTNFSINYFWNTLERLWQSLVVILTPLIFGISIASFFSPTKFKEKIVMLIFPVVCSILLVYSLPEYVAWHGDLFPERFLIAPAIFLIILSAQTINTLLNTSERLDSHIVVMITKIRKKIKVKKIFVLITIITIACPLTLLHTNYLSKFHQGYADVLEWYGSPVIEWIKNNTTRDAVFLAAEPRRLAWFTDRTFIGMTTQSGKLNVSELNGLIQRFNVTYVVIDAFLITYISHTSFFKYLYNVPLTLGRTLPVLEEDAISRIINEMALLKRQNYTLEVSGLKLVFEFSKNSRITRIYQVINATIFVNAKFIDMSTEDWRAGNYGKLIGEETYYTLTIGEGTYYTFTYRKTPLKIFLEENATKFFAWKVNEISDAKIERIEVWSNEGKHLTSIIPSSILGIWFTYINVTDIGDLRVVIRGNAGGYITMQYLMVGALSTIAETYDCNDR